MPVMRSRVGFRSGLRGAAVLLVVVLAAACGSGSSSGSVKGPAGAKENATGYTGSAVCYDLYAANKPTACAENTIGPGGGVVFHDAGSEQPWGRFLEVAPWNWNPQLGPTEAYACPGDCGAANASLLHPAVDRTQDGFRNDKPDTFELPLYYGLCETEWTGHLTGAAATTGTAVGAGRENTRLLLADPACGGPGTGGDIGAVNLVASYRGGGLADWFLPSKDELDLLRRFGNRDAIGGFAAGSNFGYVSSSVTYTESENFPDGRVWSQRFGTGESKHSNNNDTDATPVVWYKRFLVRPIRAFS